MDRKARGLIDGRVKQRANAWVPVLIFDNAFRALSERDTTDRRQALGETNSSLQAMTVIGAVLETMLAKEMCSSSSHVWMERWVRFCICVQVMPVKTSSMC